MKTDLHFPSGWVTIVELEFFHLRIDVDAVDDVKLGPRPGQLHDGLNTPVTALSRNGLIAWLPDGSAVHCDWEDQQQQFARRDGGANLQLGQVRAWSALPDLVAVA